MNDSKNQPESQMVLLFAVYVILCSKTNMHYVGVTGQEVWERIRQHKRDKKQFIDRELQHVGWENFDWWIVESHVSSNLISECEKKWINFFDCVHPKGYNKTHGGIGDTIMSEDTRKKMGASRRGRPAVNKGKKALPETKAKMSVSRKGDKHFLYGKHHSAETKAKIATTLSAVNKGENNPFYGKHHTDETRAKIGVSSQGRKTMECKHHTEETKAIMRTKALARAAAKRVAKENLAVANSTPISL